MEWEEDFGVKVEFGKDYILKRMPSIEHRDIIVSMVLRDGTEIRRQWKGRMETEKNKEKPNKEIIWNFTVGVYDMSEISGTELGKHDTNP